MISLSKQTLDRVREAAKINRKAGKWVAPDPMPKIADRKADFEMPSAEGQSGYPEDLLNMSEAELRELLDEKPETPKK